MLRNKSTELKVTRYKIRRINGYKTDKNSPIIVSSDRKCLNVFVSPLRPDLPPGTKLKTPLVPGTDYVRIVLAICAR